eukprot:gene22961-30148_t
MGFMDRLTSPRQHAPSRREQRQDEMKMQQQSQGQRPTTQQHQGQYQGQNQGQQQPQSHGHMRQSKDSQNTSGGGAQMSPRSPHSRSMTQGPMHRGRAGGGSGGGASGSDRRPTSRAEYNYDGQTRASGQYNNQGPPPPQHYGQGPPGPQYPQQGPPHTQPTQQQQGAPHNVTTVSVGSTKGFLKNLLSFAPGRPEKSLAPEAVSSGGGAPPRAEGGQAPPGGRGGAPPAVPAPMAGEQRELAPNAQRPPPPSGSQAGQDPNRGDATTNTRDMTHRISVLESQLQELDELKRRMAAEQRSVVEWRDRWNFQNVKLSAMVDMLVVKHFETDRGTMPISKTATGYKAPSGLEAAAAAAIAAIDGIPPAAPLP